MDRYLNSEEEFCMKLGLEEEAQSVEDNAIKGRKEKVKAAMNLLLAKIAQTKPEMQSAEQQVIGEKGM